MLRWLWILVILGLANCTGDETVAAYGGADRSWTLVELDGVAFSARATLTFPERGRIAGIAPCNTYTGIMSAPYPWFDAEGVAVTRKTCPELGAEAAFFTALSEVSQSEVAGETMILRNDAGRVMVFTASE